MQAFVVGRSGASDASLCYMSLKQQKRLAKKISALALSPYVSQWPIPVAV